MWHCSKQMFQIHCCNSTLSLLEITIWMPLNSFRWPFSKSLRVYKRNWRPDQGSTVNAEVVRNPLLQFCYCFLFANGFRSTLFHGDKNHFVDSFLFMFFLSFILLKEDFKNGTSSCKNEKSELATLDLCVIYEDTSSTCFKSKTLNCNFALVWVSNSLARLVIYSRLLFKHAMEVERERVSKAYSTCWTTIQELRY